jgi:flagellar M-ring protein FliF
MGSFGPLITQVRRLWGRLGRTQQMALIGVAGGALVFAFIFLNMGKQQTYVTAFTNLDLKDSAATTEQLKADGIPYQVSADGSTIKVVSEKLADARLKLAAKGLPQGGAVGFELFDKTSFGVTDFAQHINYQRALEGELSRTINTLSQVANSRVHIVVPKEELFASQQKPATASVVLDLRPGRTLDQNALQGIAHMVARSVEGLEDKYITILDTSGRMLYDGGSQDSGAGLSATQIDVEKKVEQSITNDVQSLLDRVAGPNRAAVRVKADLDFSQQEELAETYTPGGPNNQGVPRSATSTQETYNGTGGQNAGQPGATANVPGLAAQVTQQNGNAQYQRSETTTNFEVSKNTKKTTTAPGGVKRLNVSVVLDSSISEQDAAGLRDAIAAAAGIDDKRGDQLVVTTAAFSGAQGGEQLPAAKSGGNPIATYGKVVVPLVAALVVLFFVWRMSRSVTPRPLKVRAQAAQQALAPAPLADLPLLAAGSAAGGLSAPAGQQALPEPGRRYETPESAQRRQEIHDRMTNLATANPEAVAEIIHSWIAQDDKKR